QIKYGSSCPNGSNPGDQHFGRFGSPASLGHHAALVHHSVCLPERGTSILGHNYKLLGVCGCGGVIAAEGVWYRNVVQSLQQRDGLADLSRHLERVISISERRFGIAKQPQSNRSKD